MQSPSGVFFDDSLGWQKFEGTFVATGGEQYLTIGCFTSWEETQSNYYVDQASIIDTYYYVDDVSLTALDSFALVSMQTSEIPNVFTPDGDGINDLFTVTGKIGNEGTITILNRWGEAIFTSGFPFSWDGTSGGIPCSDGVYFYTFEASGEQKHGMLHLIR